MKTYIYIIDDDGYNLLTIGDTYKTLQEFIDDCDCLHDFQYRKNDEGFYVSEDCSCSFKIIQGQEASIRPKEVKTVPELYILDSKD